MNKKFYFSTLASLFFLSEIGSAEYKVGTIGSLSFTAGVQSAYISKGLDQNSDRVAYNAAIDFVVPTSIVDFYAGYSKISATGNNYTWEDARYAGVRKTIGSITLDASLVETLKAGNGVAVQNNDVDFTYKLTFAPDKAPYTIGLVYTQNDTNGSKPTTTQTVGKYYQEINGSYNFDFVTAGISYGENKNDVEVTTLKLTKSFMDADFTLSYIDAQRKSAAGVSNLDKDREYLTLGVSKTF